MGADAMSYSPGVYEGITNADYHRDPALGSTSLKTLATRTPAHYQYDKTHPKSSAAFDLGTAAHSLILEQDESGVVVIDVEAKRGKAWTEPAEAVEAAGKIALTSKEWAQVRAMRDSVMRHPLAKTALTGGAAEESVFWNHESGTVLKCRPDMLHRGGKLGNLIVDLKTVQSADAADFAKSAANFGYHIQQAHYQAGLKAATGEDFDFIFVLIEKTGAYLPAVVQLDAEDVARGAEMAERSIRIYNECSKSGRWPGYESAAPIELPRWARFQEEGILDARL
jgi:hypothetical protein